jgi:RecB family exonuclease
MARDQVRRELALRSRSAGAGPRVWCWTDLWRTAREELEGGPACLSDGAAGAVFAEAVRQSREAGEISAIRSVVDWPGYRRRLRERLARWTARELPLHAPEEDDPAATAEWGVFVRYRGLLRELDAQDMPGFAVWASKRLLQRPPGALASFEQATFLDFEAPAPAQWRIFEHALRRARSVRVTLPYEDDASASPVYEANAPIRERLRELDFDEVPFGSDLWRPAGLSAVERALFRGQGAHGYLGGESGLPRMQARAAGVVSLIQGLAIRGAPEGEGTGRLLARSVRTLLDQGVEPEDIMILFPAWGEQAEIAFEVLQAWGLPIHAVPSRPLGTDPAVAALLLVIGLPVEGWETERLIRILRNGQVRPDWPGVDPLALAAAASIIQTTHTFRGREPLERALDRIGSREKGRSIDAERARTARDLAAKVFDVLEPLDQARPYAGQVEQLFRVAATLHLGEPGAAGLEQLREALEDQSDMLVRLGRGDETWRWSEFALDVESLVQDLKAPAPPPRPASVLMATALEAAGARARFVILAGLAEGSFPTREAVEPFLALRPGERMTAASRQSFSREMLRFMSVLGSAEAGVTLVYPTTDVKGQELLRAGFLDELIELLTPEAAAACHQALGRVDPALIDFPELAGSPGDERVRAAALARTRGDMTALSALARQAEHRGSLEGTAAALQVLARRLRGTPFGLYDGLLGAADAVHSIADLFASEYRFSPSKLETYIGCPFQFFCKYVLKLQPAERWDELDEDFAERGSQAHWILERLEQMKQHAQETPNPGELAKAALAPVLETALVDASEIDLGRLEIERRRLVQTVDRYLVQVRQYENDSRGRPTPLEFEVDFGNERSKHPYLEIGEAGQPIRLQGTIDRIDLVEGPEGRGFRVIDYKTGPVPSTNDVLKGRMLQLLLYAMAVERIGLAGEPLALRDVGYWGLRKNGFQPIAFENWSTAKTALESYVADLVERLRRGIFVVDSQIDGCEGFCDFRAICRIRQVRRATKHHDRASAPELSGGRPPGPRKRRASGAGEVP